MNNLQTLHAFWSGFGIPAYDENSVPSEEERIRLHGSAFPYLTYEASADSFGHPIAQTASIWYRTSGWGDITAKEQEIADFITRGGRMLAYDGGAIWIQRESPWAQRMSEKNDDMIRRIVLNVSIEYLV